VVSKIDIGERNMSKVEFHRVLDAVGTATTTSDFIESAQAANENERVRSFAGHHHPGQSSPGPILGNTEFLQLLLGRLSAEVFKRPPSVR
jgi:hypothetical protein